MNNRFSLANNRNHRSRWQIIQAKLHLRGIISLNKLIQKWKWSDNDSESGLITESVLKAEGKSGLISESGLSTESESGLSAESESSLKAESESALILKVVW